MHHPLVPLQFGCIIGRTPNQHASPSFVRPSVTFVFLWSLPRKSSRPAVSFFLSAPTGSRRSVHSSSSSSSEPTVQLHTELALHYTHREQPTAATMQPRPPPRKQVRAQRSDSGSRQRRRAGWQLDGPGPEAPSGTCEDEGSAFALRTHQWQRGEKPTQSSTAAQSALALAFLVTTRPIRRSPHSALIPTRSRCHHVPSSAR